MNKHYGAIVIGINQYTHNTILTNAANDGREMARKLEALKYDVICLIDNKATYDDYVEAESDIMGRLMEDKIQGVILYFSGHGFITDGKDCLVLADAEDMRIHGGMTAMKKSIKLDEFYNLMRKRGAEIVIAIVDACRSDLSAYNEYDGEDKGCSNYNNDFGKKTMMPYQTFLAFSTSPKTTAKDGKDGHSKYTQALLEEIETEDLPIEQLFKHIRKKVHVSDRDQLPWENSCLVDDFCFNHGQTERHYDSVYDKSCFTSAIVDRDVCLVKSLMMNGKENLLGKLATLKKTLTPPAIFGIGRVIAGLVKQKEIEAVEVLKYNKIGLFTENGTNHLLNGILYGVYFDIEDRLCKPDGREMDILDELDRLFEQKEFDSSVKFIRHEMESFKDEIGYIPGDRNTYKVYLEIESATEDTTENNHQVWVITDMSIKDETDSLPETGKVCFNIKELRNAIRDQFWIPLAKIKCNYSEKVGNDDLFVLDKLDIADILNDYFVGNCISDMDDICHHYEYVGIDDFYIQHLMPEEEYLRAQGTFSIQVVVYLDSEEEIMDDKCIDGEYDMVLDYDNDKWSVVDIDKMKLDLPQI